VGARGVLAALAIIAFAAPQVRFGDDIAWRNLWRQHRPDERRERLLDAIREHSSPEEPIFVWGYYPELYVLAPRPPASRYSNTNYLTGMLPWENHQPGVDTSEHVVEGAWDLHDEMAELEGKVDVALVPIWGWGPRLGPGHLNPETAADALAVIRPKLAIPIHHATLSLPGSSRRWPWLLTEPAERFVAAAASRAPDVEVRVLAPGEFTVLSSLG
jgi:hypothetical protein